MAQVTLVLGTPTNFNDGNWVQWDERAAGLGDISVFSSNANARHLIRLRIFRGGDIQFQTIDTPDGNSGFSSREDLSDALIDYNAFCTVTAAGVAPDLVLTGPGSTDSTSNDRVEAYRWGNGNSAEQQTWFDAYETAGRPTITILLDDATVHAVDADGASWSFAVSEPTVTHTSLHNDPPVVTITTQGMTVGGGDSVTIQATATDIDGTVASTAWTGDGTFTPSTTPNTDWTAPDGLATDTVYDLTLTATDDDGDSGQATVQMTVSALVTHAVNAGGVSWSFVVSEPTVTGGEDEMMAQSRVTTRSNVMSRSNVISGAKDDPFHVASVFHCNHQPINHEVTLSRSQIHDLNGTPVELLPQGVNGASFEVLGVYYSKAAGAYSGGAAITINRTDSSNTLVATIPVSDMRSASAADGWATIPALSGTPDAQAVIEEGVDANTATAFTGAGGALTLTVRYVEVG